MIKDKPNKLISWLMIGVERYLLRHFSKVTFIGKVKSHPSKSCLVLMNHFSFNDGPILHRIARKILSKKFKVMIVEAQLKAFSILRYIGGFSVNKKSRSVIESLNYAADLLKNPENMLGIFPQGEVYSMHLNHLHFERGLNQILKKAKDTSFDVIFSVALLDYLDGFKPHARVYLLEYTGPRDLAEMEKSFNEFYGQCKRKQRELHNPPEESIRA